MAVRLWQHGVDGLAVVWPLVPVRDCCLCCGVCYPACSGLGFYQEGGLDKPGEVDVGDLCDVYEDAVSVARY